LTEHKKLLLATNNRGKLREYAQLLKGVPFGLITLADAGISIEVSETGSTMLANAVKKATEYAQISGLITMADDSGLEVDALGGEPGVMSRRYAGENSTDEERNEFLLKKIRQVSWDKRTARFRCIIAISLPNGSVETVDGICEGVIAYEPKGYNGFGYDPIFYLSELGKSMAELTLEEKNRLSHRARAATKAKAILENLTE